MSSRTPDKSSSTGLSSQLAFFTLLAALFLIYLLPAPVSSSLLNLPLYFFFVTATLLSFYLIITFIRRRRIFFTTSPLSISLVVIFVALILTIVVKRPASFSLFLLRHPSSLLINFALISLCAATLIKKNNALFLLKVVSLLASCSSLTMIFNVLANLFHLDFLDLTTLVNLNPLYHFSFIVLGFASLFALFFKKGRFPRRTLLLLPLFTLGITAVVLSTISQFSTIRSLSFSSTLEILQASLFQNQQFSTRAFIFGQPHLNFADIYSNFTPVTLNSYNLSPTLQAFNVPLTLFLSSGLIGVLAWLFFFGQVTYATFSRTSKNYNYLFFLLWISLIVQLFTPLYPGILLLQACLISFADTKTRHRPFLKLSPKTSVSRSQSLIIFSLCLTIFSLSAAWWCVQYHRSYIARFFLQQALNQPDLNLAKINQAAHLAQARAPHDDYLQKLAASSDLEVFLDQSSTVVDTPAFTEFGQTILAAAHQAVALNPYQAANYILLGDIYQELSPYNHSPTAFNEQASNAYAQALLLQPSNPDLYLRAARFYQLHDKPDLALTLTQTAIKLRQNYLPALYQLAQIYQLQGQLDLARTHFQEALTLLDLNSATYQENFDLIQKHLAQLAV